MGTGQADGVTETVIIAKEKDVEMIVEVATAAALMGVAGVV